MLRSAATDLRLLQEQRREADPELAERVDAFCVRLDAYAAGEHAFTLLVDDPAGNSALEWFGDWGGGGDPVLQRTFYARTHAQNVAIGCMSQEQADAEEVADAAAAMRQARGGAVPGAGAPKLGCSIVRSDGVLWWLPRLPRPGSHAHVLHPNPLLPGSGGHVHLLRRVRLPQRGAALRWRDPAPGAHRDVGRAHAARPESRRDQV